MAHDEVNLVDEITRLRGKLLDPSLRNPLLSYKKSVQKTLQIVDELPDEVYRRLVDTSKPMKLVPDKSLDVQAPLFDSDELLLDESKDTKSKNASAKSSFSIILPTPGDGKVDKRFTDDSLQTNNSTQKLQTLSRTISREAKASIDETGINYLHLAIGFLSWRETPGTEPRLAPLILVPINIEARTSSIGRLEYYICWNEDDVQTNPSLRKKLESDFEISLPEFDEIEGPESYFRKVLKAIPDELSWGLERQMLLGFFSFHKLSMYADIAPEVWLESGALSESSLASMLILGGNENGADGVYARDYDVDDHPIANKLTLPLDADSSQQSAIADIAAGKNLVIEGPPGTGKSQTIANAVANAIKNGRTVLFVAEKHAALEVVQKRLSNAGLGDFCLDLHGHAVAPKKVMESLGLRLYRSDHPKPNNSESKIRLEDSKRKLTNYLEDMSKIVGPFKEPVYDLFWRIVQLRQIGVESIRNIACKTDFDLQSFEEANASLRAFQTTLKDYENPKASAWWGFFPTEVTPAEIHRINESLDGLEKLASTIQANVDGVQNVLQTGKDEALEFLSRSDISELKTLSESPASNEFISLSRLDDPGYRSLVTNIHSANSSLSQTTEELNGLLSVTREEAIAECQKLPPSLWKNLERVPLQVSLWRLKEIRVWAQSTADLCEKLLNRINSWTSLGLLGIDRFSDYESALQQLHLLQHPIVSGDRSISPDLFYDQAKITLSKAKAQSDLLSSRQEKIVSQFHLASIPDRSSLLEILKKYRSTSKPFYRVLDKKYRHCVRQISEFARFPKNFRPKQIIAALESLESFEKDKQEFENNALLMQLLGKLFAGISTEWEKVSTLLNWVATAKKFGMDATQVNSLLPHQNDIRLSCPVKLVKSEIEQFKTQFDSEQAKQLGYTKQTIVSSRIQDLALRLQENVSQFIGLDKVSSLLVKGKNASVKEAISLNQSITAHQKASDFLKYVRGSGEPESQRLLDSLSDTAFDCKSLVDWYDTFKKLNLPGEQNGILANEAPHRECMKVFMHHQAICKAIQEWNDVRAAIIGSAEVSNSWLQPTQNNKIRTDLSEMIELILNERERLPAWISGCRSLFRCRRAGVGAFSLAALDEDDPNRDFAKVFQLTLFERIAEQELQNSRMGFNFTTKEMEDIRNTFKTIDRSSMKSASSEIAHSASSRIPPVGNGKGRVGDFTEMALIRHEIGKKSKHCRIRDLMNRAGTAVQALKPVFLMSPLSLARYIPSDSIKFDLVIMDEASQIKPEDAIGAILRAKQLVVVGDPKQLPPTSFFDNANEDLDDEDATQFDNAESILEVAMKSFQPYRRLRWHYRSQHENLIQFSNHRFYESDLIIFPSAKGISDGYGIRHYYVEGATCVKGVNMREAEFVVQRIIDHAVLHPAESLGVAAFNQAQAQLITDLLDKACDEKSEVNEAVQKLKDLDDDLFIKNLERIQGDERDVIFVSYTYGRDPLSNKLFQRFGPINSAMGWRRLNVMVTRSRKRMEVISSIRPGEIHSGPDKSLGINAYREFLEYAETGRMIESGAETDRPPDSPFEEAVAKVISSFGLEPVFQVGVAGYFIDIGVRRRGESRDFILGVECDGATYHSSKSARDRDRLREEIVRMRGWKLHRIWSTEWFLNQKQEELRLKKVLEQCLEDQAE